MTCSGLNFVFRGVVFVRDNLDSCMFSVSSIIDAIPDTTPKFS